MTFLEELFGEGITLVQILVYLTVGIFGLITSIIFDIYSSGAATKDLSWNVWWQDNKFRLLLSILMIPLAMMFAEELIGMKVSTWSMFITGFTSDKIIENLMQRRRRKKDANKKN